MVDTACWFTWAYVQLSFLYKQARTIFSGNGTAQSGLGFLCQLTKQFPTEVLMGQSDLRDSSVEAIFSNDVRLCEVIV